MSSRLRKTAVKGEQEEYDEKQDCPVPYIACVCKGVPVPKSPDGPLAGVRMRCKNDRCHLATILLHKKCFEQLEETLLKILSNLGSARGWTDAQLRSNLWEKKGQTLIAKLLRCHCGQGLMSLDVDFYKKRELEEQQQQAASVAEARLRKKGAKRSKLPALNFSNNTPVSAELLQNDFVSVGRRFCHGQTSHSASALIYGNDQSDSDAEIPFERKSATPPVQSILFVEKPKPLSIGHLKPKSDLEAVPPRPLALFRQRKATVKSHKSSIGNNHKLSSAESQSQQHAKSMQIRISCSNGKASEQQQLMSRVELGSKVETKQPQQPKKLPVMRDNRHPIDRGAMSAGPNQHPSTALTQKTTQHMGEEPENYYSLFDNRSHGFYLGEILLGETFLPGLVLPRMFPHSL